jgi:hypothetical protein
VSLVPANISDDVKAIAAEIDRIHESALWSAQCQLEQAKLWRLVNMLLGVPAAVLAAVSGGTGLSQAATDTGSPVVPAVLALIAAGLSATLTTINASRRMTQAQTSGNAYLELQTAARQRLTIDLVTLSRDEARDQLQQLTSTRDDLNKTADPPSRYAYWIAGRNIRKGGQTYAADEEG